MTTSTHQTTNSATSSAPIVGRPTSTSTTPVKSTTANATCRLRRVMSRLSHSGTREREPYGPKPHK